MDGVRVVFDASPYVLLEAIGDSESQHSGGAEEAESGGGTAEDDAQSCSYGTWAYSYSDGGVRGVGGVGADSEYDCCGQEVEEDGGGDSDYGEEEEEEEEDGVVDQLCGGGKAAPPTEGDKLNKSQVCADTNVNDEERDRLFWEACLAS